MAFIDAKNPPNSLRTSCRPESPGKKTGHHQPQDHPLPISSLVATTHTPNSAREVCRHIPSHPQILTLLTQRDALQPETMGGDSASQTAGRRLYDIDSSPTSPFTPGSVWDNDSDDDNSDIDSIQTSFPTSPSTEQPFDRIVHDGRIFCKDILTKNALEVEQSEPQDATTLDDTDAPPIKLHPRLPSQARYIEYLGRLGSPGSRNGVLLTTCLQCAVKGLPCDIKLPSCSRCIRNHEGDICLLQATVKGLERVENWRSGLSHADSKGCDAGLTTSECVPKVSSPNEEQTIIRLATDTEANWARKMERTREVGHRSPLVGYPCMAFEIVPDVSLKSCKTRIMDSCC
jgi:hypothetical protein